METPTTRDHPDTLSGGSHGLPYALCLTPEAAIEQQEPDEDTTEYDLTSRFADLDCGQQAGQNGDQDRRGGDADIGASAARQRHAADHRYDNARQHVGVA